MTIPDAPGRMNTAHAVAERISAFILLQSDFAAQVWLVCHPNDISSFELQYPIYLGIRLWPRLGEPVDCASSLVVYQCVPGNGLCRCYRNSSLNFQPAHGVDKRLFAMQTTELEIWKITQCHVLCQNPKSRVRPYADS